MDIYTNYKWQFLRRNKDYQSCYDLYELFYKKEEDSLLKEWFVEESCDKFQINEMVDYKKENCESNIFIKKNIIFHQLGPYSLDDLNGHQDALFNIWHEFEASTAGKFDYLKADEKSLLTITIDIATPVSSKEMKLFFKVLEGSFKNYGTKNILKAYRDEKKLKSYLVAYDEKYINGLSYSKIYKKLQSKGLRPVTKEHSDVISADINQLLERANLIIENAWKLDL